MEFGSWDPQLSAMVNMTYGGTLLNNGQPANDTACTTSFDQTGFMMGTSASLFNVSVFNPRSVSKELNDTRVCTSKFSTVSTTQ